MRPRLKQRHVPDVAARALDIAIVIVLAPAALVLGAFIAAAIVIDSPGPVLYRASRIGRGGRPFRMLKFRTMLRDAAGPGLRAHEDSRQTPVGRGLSQSRLDELPQLWNVLRGDMRLVGPRPEAEEFVLEHADAYEEILRHPPGLTGATQLAFADEGAVLARVEPHERRDVYVEHLLPGKVEMDLAYVRGRSLLGDLRILLRTFTLPSSWFPVRTRTTSWAPPRWQSLALRVGLAAATFALPALYAAQVAAPVA